MPGYAEILYEVSGAVARLTLNRRAEVEQWGSIRVGGAGGKKRKREGTQINTDKSEANGE